MRPRPRRLAAALLATAAAGLPLEVPAAQLGWEVGVTAGYGDNLYLAADPAGRQGAPQLAGRAGALALWTLSDDFAAWLHGGYDAWFPVGHDAAASHGVTSGAGLVWLATERLSVDLAPLAMVRVYPAGLDPVLLVGGSASAELTLAEGLSTYLAGYYLRRLSADPVLTTGAGGAGPGIAWRPSKRWRLTVEYTLEAGDPTVEGQTSGASPGLLGELSEGYATHRFRMKLRVRLGEQVFLEPDYRFVRGSGLDAAGEPASYVAHTARIGLVWRR